MALNAYFAWNLSVSEVEGRFKVTRNAFYAALCEELIAFKDTTGEEDAAALIGLPVCETLGGHRPIPVNHKDRMRCAVCKLEEPWMDAKKIKREYGKGSRQQRHLAVCSVCGITAHSLPVDWKRVIFEEDALQGLSCFQIAHSQTCSGLWITKGSGGRQSQRMGKAVRKKSYTVSIAHPLYKHLMQAYGLGSHARKKRRTGQSESNQGEEDIDSESEHDELAEEDEEDLD